uniref:Protein kinase domain-containing protein n=1 Tax=viral metagenome TaxID=1070528 RepID=A0A6C0LTQ4_9ZZZZ
MNRKESKNYDSSEEDTEFYRKALLTNLTASLESKTISKEKNLTENKPTETRINFVKTILDGNKLKPMIDFDNCDTESYANTKLNKKIISIKELFMNMNIKLKYIKSGTTGHTFKAISAIDKSIVFAVKVCAYPKDDYGEITNLSRPENAELRMLKLLSYFVINRCTPHLVLPIGTFNTSIKHFIKVDEFINLEDKKNDSYKKFITEYNNGKFDDFVSVLISEWANGGDLLDYIRKNYSRMKLEDWTIIFFQILFTLARIHEKYPAFRHNDMKANNILIEIKENPNSNNTATHYNYHMKDKGIDFIIPHIKMQVKIWDFDFACINGTIENNKVNSDWTKKMNITKNQNRYYDMHYFFNTLINERFFPQFYKGGVPEEIIEFIHRVVPEQYRIGSKNVNKKGRIQIDTEYMTPKKVLIRDPLFRKYRYNRKNN